MKKNKDQDTRLREIRKKADPWTIAIGKGKLKVPQIDNTNRGRGR